MAHGGSRSNKTSITSHRAQLSALLYGCAWSPTTNFWFWKASHEINSAKAGFLLHLQQDMEFNIVSAVDCRHPRNDDRVSIQVEAIMVQYHEASTVQVLAEHCSCETFSFVGTRLSLNEKCSLHTQSACKSKREANRTRWRPWLYRHHFFGAKSPLHMSSLLGSLWVTGPRPLQAPFWADIGCFSIPCSETYGLRLVSSGFRLYFALQRYSMHSLTPCASLTGTHCK